MVAGDRLSGGGTAGGPPAHDRRLLVEAAHERDAHALHVLHRRVLDERDWFITLPHEYAGTAATKRQLVRDLDRMANSAFFVAREGRDLVGFLTLQGGVLARMRHVAKLEIMVDAAARGRGVGTALLGEAVSWAVANPLLHKLGLHVFADNRRAIHLYEQFGFREEGRRLGEYRDEDGRLRDDVLMCRSVR